MLPETEIFYKLKDKTQDRRANLARAIDTYAAIGAIVEVDPQWIVDNYLAIVEFLKEQKLSPEEYFRNTEFPRKELAASRVHPIMESVGVFVYDMHAKLARDPHYLSNLDLLPSMTINLLLSRSAEYMAKFRDLSSSTGPWVGAMRRLSTSLERGKPINLYIVEKELSMPEVRVKKPFDDWQFEAGSKKPRMKNEVHRSRYQELDKSDIGKIMKEFVAWRPPRREAVFLTFLQEKYPEIAREIRGGERSKSYPPLGFDLDKITKIEEEKSRNWKPGNRTRLSVKI